VKQTIEDKKIIKGNNSNIRVGTKDKDKITGNVKDRFIFLKNSISSNKFKIIPSDKKTRRVIKIILENFAMRYL